MAAEEAGVKDQAGQVRQVGFSSKCKKQLLFAGAEGSCGRQGRVKGRERAPQSTFVFTQQAHNNKIMRERQELHPHTTQQHKNTPTSWPPTLALWL